MPTPETFIPFTESDIFSIDPLLTENSDAVVSSQKAVKSYVDNQIASQAAAISTGDAASVATLRNGVPTAGNDLNKLYNLILAINAIIGGSTADGDNLVNTVAELLSVFSTYSEGVDISTLIASKLSKSANLSDLTDPAQARTNLSLGALALLASIATGNIDNNAVTLAKFQQIATASFLARTTAGNGNVEVLSVAQVKTLLNYVKGDVGLGNVPNIDATKNQIDFRIENGTSVLTTGIKKKLKVNFPFTITGWNLISDKGETGSIQMDIWKDSDANYPPTNADSIFATKPSITSAQKNEATGLNVPVAAGDWLFFNIDSVSTFTEISLQVYITKS